MTDSPEQRSAPLAGASDVMRSLGLLVDGPVVWGSAVRSRAPGVFVVELPAALPSAPVDLPAIEAWLARAPDLTLNGERPTSRELAAFLHTFWLPHEPILYVGRSAKSLGSRVAALYATPLGDARPFAGGHWLKTLSVLPRLRLWWADTDAYEEYEDGVLAAVAARTPPAVAAMLPVPGQVLPFANLAASDGTSKASALKASLRQPPDAPTPGPVPRGSGVPRAARASAAKRSQPAKPRAARATAARPTPEPTLVSRAGLDQLEAELEDLRTKVRPGVIERVKAARELGDLRENADYEAARKEQSFVEGRIQAIEALIRAAVVVGTPVAADGASVGSTVVVEGDDGEQTFVLVGSSEADPAAGRISYSSPVGQALLGRRAGDEVTVQLPRSQIGYRVREVR